MNDLDITQREKTIALRYAVGETYKEIAASLCISPATVRNHMANVYRKLGVKNKSELLFVMSDSGITSRVVHLVEEENLTPATGASIAIMPFTNQADPGLNYLIDGVTTSIHNNLTRHQDIFVSARSSCMAVSNTGSDSGNISKRLGVGYVVQGAASVESNSINLYVELVDGNSNSVLWSGKFDRPLCTIVSVESEIASEIAAALSLKITDSEYGNQEYLSTSQLESYHWRLRGQRSLELGGVENIGRAQTEYGRAIELESNSAAAHSGLSMAYGYACDQLFTDDYAASLYKHKLFAEKAIDLDEKDSRGHYAMGCALSMAGDPEQADFHATRAVELNPSEYHNLCARGYTLLALGKVRQSVSCFSESLPRNPLAPSSCLLALGLIEYIQGNYSQAAYSFSRMSSAYIQRDSSLAAAYAQLDYTEVAHIAANEFKALFAKYTKLPTNMSPEDLSIYWSRVYAYLNGKDLDHMREGLVKAGLPV